MSVAPFPHRYEVSLADRTIRSAPRDPIAAGAPPQFGGDERAWSPEELLVGAALECLWTTFEAYARRDALAIHGWSGKAVGVLDRGVAGGVPTFTSITLRPEILVAQGDEARAEKLIATAEDRCIISRALRVPVTVEATIRAA
ncbi:MAG TPA: OsmC family protein [Kofleriaceae bacterium]|nr:OsmC family protein [Kofleriaceae bacterium]